MDPNERQTLAHDVRASAEARAELGADYEPALIESLVERIDDAVERRVRAEVGDRPRGRVRRRFRGGYPVPLAYASLGCGIPITAVAGGTAGVAGVAIAWLGVVGVNVAAALGTRTEVTDDD